MRKLPLGGLAALLVACGACGAAPDSSVGEGADQQPENTGTVKQAIASVMGGAEHAVDAPWRLEPTGVDSVNQTNTYGPIPIVVSLNDAAMQRDAETRVPYGTFCGVRIYEHWNDGATHYDPLDPRAHDPEPPEWRLETFITPTDPDLREIERSDKWSYSSDIAANHRLCRHWRGEDCTNILDASTSTQWHATVAYVPRQLVGAGSHAQHFSPVRSGDDVKLSITAEFAMVGKTCAQTAYRQKFGETVTVHLGEAELPRFDGGWVYGDLHHHSQGTDNDGETGYAYRPTLQAMRAMGLDFAFATDHASDSGQVTDLDPIFIDNMPDIPYTPEFLEEKAQELLNNLLKGATILQSIDAQRDMSHSRFAYLHQWLNRPATGANAEAMRAFAGNRRTPRLFLGGEVDVVPEISESERTTGLLKYGNNKSYSWAEPCWALPSEFLAAGRYTTVDACPNGRYDLLEPVSEGGRYMVKDIQGLLERWFARQHIVYLPKDSTRADAFVSSRTGLYGGAHERLKDILRPDYWNTMTGKGYGFLAHPVAHASGAGFGRLGPDIVPYSDVQLKTAFDSPTILGLQLWNEDTRINAGLWQGTSPPAYWELHNGVAAWDKMLQWGLRPSQTSSLAWLSNGMPRRVYMAGGSDAHGDWNYRREGSISGTSHITDTALGKPRNLVNIGLSRPDSVLAWDGQNVGAFTQEQLTSALAAGAFSVTDGPAVRIAIDSNNNGVIDDGDVPMGSVGYLGSGSVPVIIEWLSTSEFQAIANIDVYVGAASTVTDKTAVYAPTDHGARIADGTGGLDPNVYKNGTATYRFLKDGYMADRTGILRIVPTAADYVNGNPYHGRRKLIINAYDYPVGTPTVTPGPTTCKKNVWCNKPGFLDKCEITCTDGPSTYTFDNPQTPNRLYVRAFARTLRPLACAGIAKGAPMGRSSKCVERLAYTNPVWIVPKPRLVGNVGPLTTAGVTTAPRALGS